MPNGLLKPLNEQEVLDLLAYLLSRGNSQDVMFRKVVAGGQAHSPTVSVGNAAGNHEIAGGIICTGFRMLVAIGLMLVCGGTRAADPKPLEIGKPAPKFELPGVDGKTYRLDDFRDAKLLVVVFTCNHCPTAQAYDDRIIQLDRDFKNRGVALVAISPNDPRALRLDELGYTEFSDSFDEMKIRAKDRDYKFPYLYDGETQKISQEFGVLATPHVFIFDRDRKLRYQGRIDNSDIHEVTSHEARDAIEALLAG